MFTRLWHRPRSSAHRAPRRQPIRPRDVRPSVECLEERCLLSTDVVLAWNQAVLAAIRADRPTGAFVTRDLAIVHAAIYDAVNAIDGSHTVFHVAADAPPDASPEAAADAAGLFTASALYPTHTDLFQATYRTALAGIPDGQAKDDGLAVGRFVAEQTLIWRATDGADAVVDYTPGDQPGDWRPAPPGFGAAQTPQWPFVTPFALDSASQFRPDPPPALTGPEYAAAFNEVKEIGRVDSTTRTPAQTEIAQFWEGKGGTITLPGYMNQIAETVAQQQGLSLADEARLFAQLDVTLADEWIALFDGKYTYNLWRPITAIRLADQVGNPDTEADPDWLPLLNTAPHPSYGSAHGGTSNAAAATLAAFFGTDDIGFTVASEDLPGVTHSFDSFSAAADEATSSVVYAGVHFPFDNAASRTQGEAVAQFVADNFFLPVGGSPGRTHRLTPVHTAASGNEAGVGSVGVRTDVAIADALGALTTRGSADTALHAQASTGGPAELQPVRPPILTAGNARGVDGTTGQRPAEEMSHTLPAERASDRLDLPLRSAEPLANVPGLEARDVV